MVLVIYSPTKGYFIGCENAGFGGVEGAAQFSHDLREALDLSCLDTPVTVLLNRHLGYVRSDASDAIGLQGKDRADIYHQAVVLTVHET